MVILPNLVFLELQKTGSMFVRSILARHLGATVRGKHNRLNRRAGLAGPGVLVAGGVRDPWDWYVSLWAYGCQCLGGPYVRQTSGSRTDQHDFRYRLIPDLRRREQQNAYMRAIDGRAPDAWLRLYADVNDPLLFREWLYRVHSPERRFDTFDDFGHSSLWPFAGLFSYLFCYLYFGNVAQIFSGRLNSPARLAEVYGSAGILDRSIRMERLGDDLLSILQEAGYMRGEEEVRAFRSEPASNTSSRERNLALYYDGEAARFVADRDALIVRIFGYAPPAA